MLGSPAESGLVVPIQLSLAANGRRSREITNETDGRQRGCSTLSRGAAVVMVVVVDG